MPEGMIKMKLNDILWAAGILTAGVALFGAFLFMVGVCDIAYGGNSQAARFAGWVVNAIR
jgi:hypothetical protein